METKETDLNSETKGKIVQIFSNFMARVAKLEELAAAGNRFLIIFRQGLEFIRRPSIDKTSELLEKVIEANNTDRIQSYIKAGYAHASSRTENLNKLHMSNVNLLDHTTKAKSVINELECFVEDVKLALEASNETIQYSLLDFNHLADACIEEEMVPPVAQKPEIIDYAAMMAVVYSMVKQDYVMQENIVSSLNLKTSPGELESYCLMWSLRPFVNDDIMHQAWKLIP